jgi:N6-adenosine-specific RNA methylase IME4
MLDRELLRRLPPHLRIEIEENVQRKDFTESELGAIQRALINELSKPEMKRQGARTDLTCTAQDRTSSSRRQNSTEKVAKLFGESERTVRRRLDVLAAAEAEPDKFGHLVEQMDETGKVDHASKVVNRVRRHNTIAAEASNVAVLEHPGPFPLFYADPPWKFEVYSEKGLDRTADQHYPTLTDQEIIDFKIDGKTVPEIAHRDASLFLWCTSSNFVRALAIVKGWGFDYKTNAIWDKQRTGTGLVFMNMHEHLLYCIRGSMPAPQYLPPSIFRYPRGEHSAKPPEIRAEIEKMYPAFDERTRLELFARSKPAGWSAYGPRSVRSQRQRARRAGRGGRCCAVTAATQSHRRTVEEILAAHGITRPKFDAAGSGYTTCPHCSRLRKPANQTKPVLHVTADGQGVGWFCNHCRWSGKEFFEPRKGQRYATTYDYHNEKGMLLFQTVRLFPKDFRQRAKVICRHRIFVIASVIFKRILTNNFYSVFMNLSTNGRFYLLKNYMRVMAVIRFILY